MYFLDERFLVFLPALICASWLAGSRARNWVLLLASIGWLAVFSLPTVVALSALVVGVIYPIARTAASARRGGDEKRANAIGWIGVGVVLAIATALRLKASWATGRIDEDLLRWVGFSYFLLKAIHVMRATARGIVEPQSPLTLLSYFLFLPTLTSGPLYRVDVFAQQLTEPRRLTWDLLNDGIQRIVIGIGKKVVLAQSLGKLAVTLHASQPTQPAAYVLTYVMLYFDFSGYSDIAIGTGRLLGFHIPENFKHPFTATTLTQFWRNWHATLGDWLRENVFLPLGGMRATGARLYAIVLGSMLVIGVWHGFSARFVLWGAYHGTMLLIENWVGLKPMRVHNTPRWRRLARYAIVQIIVMGGMFAFIGADLGR